MSVLRMDKWNEEKVIITRRVLLVVTPCPRHKCREQKETRSRLKNISQSKAMWRLLPPVTAGKEKWQIEKEKTFNAKADMRTV